MPTIFVAAKTHTLNQNSFIEHGKSNSWMTRNNKLCMVLCDAILISNAQPTRNSCYFTQFDKSCYILMVLKSAESYTHAMISTLLPCFFGNIPKQKPLPKLFKPAAAHV